jgi:hypothetical protein
MPLYSPKLHIGADREVGNLKTQDEKRGGNKSKFLFAKVEVLYHYYHDQFSPLHQTNFYDMLSFILIVQL